MSVVLKKARQNIGPYEFEKGDYVGHGCG